MNKCEVCGKPIEEDKYLCSKECCDRADGTSPRGSYYPDECRERENDPNDYSGPDMGSKHSGHSGCG